MYWVSMLVTIVHVTACVILILVVLLQSGSKADLGVFSGSGTQTAFGGAGPATLLHKITVAAAAIFMITCMYLYINTGKHTGESDVSKKLPGAPATKSAPATPTPGTPATPGTPKEQGSAPAPATQPPPGGESKEAPKK